MDNKKPKKRSKVGVYALGTTLGVIAAGGAGFGIAAAVWYDKELKAPHEITNTQTAAELRGYKVSVNPEGKAKKGDSITFRVDSNANVSYTYEPKAIRITSIPNKKGEPVSYTDYLLEKDGTGSYHVDVTIVYSCDMKYEVIFEQLQDWVVTFDTDGGTGSFPQQDVKRGQTVTKPSKDPEKKGYKFKGWYKDNDLDKPFDFNTVIEGNITLKAVYEIEKYTVVWKIVYEDKTERILETDTNVPYGTMPTYNEKTPTMDDTAEWKYTFAGWNEQLVPVTENAAYTAKFTKTKQTYLVNFHSTYGTVPSVNLNYGEKVTKPELTQEGYTLVGWFYNDGGAEKEWLFDQNTVTGPLELTAKWVINQYTVTFDSVGGDPVSPITQDYNTSINKPTDPTKAGCTFLGWYCDGVQVKFPYTIKKNVTFTARWDNIKYHKVVFDAQNGSALDVKTIKDGDTVAVPTQPTRDGYTFKGWFTTRDGSTPFDFATAIKADKTAYAQWTITTYTVTFHNGTTTTPVTVNHGDKVQRPVNPTPEAGKKFVTWVTTDGGSTEFDFTKPIEANTDVYAKFADCDVISIAITTMPKVEFTTEEEFTYAGMVVTGTLEDGNTTDVTANVTVDSSTFVKGTPGTYPISVTYKKGTITKTISYDVTIVPTAVTGISVDVNEVTIEPDQTIATAATVQVIPNDATNKKINFTQVIGGLITPSWNESTGVLSIIAGSTPGTEYLIASTDDGKFTDVIKVVVYKDINVAKAGGAIAPFTIPDTIPAGSTSITITTKATEGVSDVEYWTIDIEVDSVAQPQVKVNYGILNGTSIKISIPEIKNSCTVTIESYSSHREQ